MGQDTTTADAGKLLHQLHTHFREHPVNGPTEGRTTRTTAPAPLSLATVDHITATVREIADATRAINPAAGPLPARVQDVYAWMHAHTAHADEITQQRLDVIEYRQYLEHAIRTGDVKVVRPHRCPKCRTLGLMWRPELQRALCTNRKCVDRDGRSTTVSLARLAHEHITSRKNLRPASTT